MNEALLAILDEMVLLAQEKLPARDGEARLRERGRRHEGIRLEVFWEEEALTGAVHYDALLRTPGSGAVSVGYCPDRSVPWAMRGAFRWGEADMLRVDGLRVGLDDVVAQLDFLWDQPAIATRLVDSALIRNAADADPAAFAPSDEELQAAAEGYRRKHRLFTVEATKRWMDRHGLTLRGLESMMEGFVRATKLRERVVAGREESYFAEHRADFDVAVIARIVVGTRERARSVFERLRAGEADLLTVATEALRPRTRRDAPWEQPPPLLARVRRCELAPERAAAIFAAAAGAVLPAVETEAGHEIVIVRAIEPAAELDAATRVAVRDRLFEMWLEERRSASTIEWLWGARA
jgi:putative peptide maturation system protein